MNLKKIAPNTYESTIEKSMNVPARIFASEKILESMKKDKTFEQISHVAKLPGIQKYAIALPDAHQGYGFPIGGVAAFDLREGIVSPGGVGYDINCSVRLLKTNLTKKDILKKQEILAEKLFLKIPSGVGRGGKVSITYSELDKILEEGAHYLVSKGYGKVEDCQFTEDFGKLSDAHAKDVSDRAKRRGIGQLGTIGAGNHFVEVQVVEKIFDSKTAKTFGLHSNQVVIMIHCGSRGLGHQVASDYIQAMEAKWGAEHFPDRELIYAPLTSDLGKKYLSAMRCAANFAFANKQILTHFIRETFKEIFENSEVDVLYDVSHNIAKVENHVIEGKKKEVCVHRKGATRSFGKNNPAVPKKYRSVGQPVLVPGSMGTASYVLCGTAHAESETFGSTVHGAGRKKSRSLAIKEFSGNVIQKNLAKKQIIVKAGNVQALAEEAPEAYKDIEDVVSVVHALNISTKVARLKPVIVIKG